MTDPSALLALSGAGLAATALTSVALLKAWSGWLDLKRGEVVRTGAGKDRRRSEIDRLRERVRRLEAIASGVEL
jgi:hypothetical protein